MAAYQLYYKHLYIPLLHANHRGGYHQPDRSKTVLPYVKTGSIKTRIPVSQGMLHLRESIESSPPVIPLLCHIELEMHHQKFHREQKYTTKPYTLMLIRIQVNRILTNFSSATLHRGNFRENTKNLPKIFPKSPSSHPSASLFSKCFISTTNGDHPGRDGIAP